MPTLYERLFGTNEKIEDERLLLADIIERGLRLGKGEKFEEPLTGVTPLFGQEVGLPKPIEFDRPGAQPLDDIGKSYLKSLFERTDQAAESLKSRLGLSPPGGFSPQEAVKTRFGENPDPTFLESAAGALGAATPFLAGGVLAPGLVPGALGGAGEELVTGGSPADVLFSTLGGGVGGFLGKLGRNLGKEGAESISRLDLRRELFGIERAIDTGVEHVVPRPDFDFFAALDHTKVNANVFRQLSKDLGVPQPTITAAIVEAGGDSNKLASKLDDFFDMGIRGEPLPDISQPTILRTGEATPQLSPRLQELLDKRAAGIPPGTRPPIEEMTPHSRVIGSKFDYRPFRQAFKDYGITPEEFVTLREAQIIDSVSRFEQGIKSTPPGQKFKQHKGMNQPLLRRADAIISEWLDPVIGRKPRENLLRNMTNVERYQLARERTAAGLVSSVQKETLDSAKAVVKKTTPGVGVSQKEWNAVVDSLDSQVVMKMAKEADSAAGRSAQKVTAAVCEAISRGK